MTLVIVLIIIFLSCIFLANSIAALIVEKNRHPDTYWNSTVLIIGGFCTFLTIIFLLISTFLDSNLRDDNLKLKEQLKGKCVEYEIVNEPLYRKK